MLYSKMINDIINYTSAFYFVLPYVAYSALITPGVTGEFKLAVTKDPVLFSSPLCMSGFVRKL